MTIQLLSPEEIDTVKWNSCVHFATQPGFFGYIWYLNAVSRDWVGLVEGDYETVLPLFYSRDWLGRKVFVQPTHLAPSGPFSQHVMSRPRVLALLRALPPRTRNLLLAWEGQVGLAEVEDTPVSRLLLPLYKDFTTLRDAFSPENQEETDWVVSSPSPEAVTDFWYQHTPRYGARDADRHRLRRIFYQAMHRGQAFSSGISRPSGELLAAALFVFSHQYIFRLASAAAPGQEGQQALTALYRNIIQTHAGKHLMIDFNGDKAGKGFGATELHYTRVEKSA